MNLQNMHIWFRQYAQRMGLQNVRALLPDQIDVFINTAIDDYVNDLIRNNVGVTNDRVITDNSKIGTINALKTLYKVDKINVVEDDKFKFKIVINRKDEFNRTDTTFNNLSVKVEEDGGDIYTFDTSNPQLGGTSKNLSNELVLSDVTDKNVLNGELIDTQHNNRAKVTTIYSKTTLEIIVEFLDYNFSSSDTITLKIGSTFNTNLVPFKQSILDLDKDEINSGKFSFKPKNVLFYSDFAINYKYSINGIYKADFDITNIPVEEGSPTNFYPIRIIDDIYLADVLQDFILKPTLRSPIITFHAIVENDEKKQNIDIYFGTPKDGINKKIKGTKENPLFFNNNLVPYQIRMSYISKPAKVQYNEDQLESNIDCDLPENTHVDILKHAVDLYRISMQGSVFANQQQQQVQNQEIARNNARAEGYAPATT